MADTLLAGRTILVAASENRVEALAEPLRERGADVIPFPTVRIVPPRDPRPLDDTLRRWSSYDWVVFTSTNSVGVLVTRARALGTDLSKGRMKIAAVGPATKAAAEGLGLTVHVVPLEFLTDEITAALGDVRGMRILLPRSSLARKSLLEGLRNRGAHVDEVEAYDAVPATPSLKALRNAARVDYLVFTSASAARNLVSLLPSKDLERLRSSARAACIGPVTAEAARDVGFRVAWVAKEHTIPGLVKTLEEVSSHG